MFRCMSAKRLIARRRVGLTAAERIRLEDHLTSCISCLEEASALGAMSQMIEAEASGHRPSRHARAITRVLNAASEAELPAPPPRAAPYLLAGAMAAATVLGIAAFRAGWGAPDPDAGPVHAMVDPGDGQAAQRPEPAVEREPAIAAALEAGDLRVDGVAIAAGDAIRAGVEVETKAGAVLALGPALVDLAAGGKAVWGLDRTTLRLDAGTMRAQVDPDRDSPFRVLTDRFIVEVLGTEFEVTEAGVRVDRGAVRVTDLDGALLAARVEAGESWSFRLAAEAAERVRPAVDVSETLGRARSRLAGGDVSGARALIRDALAAEPSRVERAEAETLLAECALVAGDRARAARRYLSVAESYRRLSAGENALFAAARLERELGNAARATELFELYLARYPSGRFRSDAELRLAERPRR